MKSWLPFTILIVLVVVAAIIVSSDASPTEQGSPRTDRLAELREQMKLSDNQRLEWAPWLNAEAFDVGTVFAGENFGQAYTSACNKLTVSESGLRLNLGAGKLYKATAEVAEAARGAFSIEGAKSVEYRISAKRARLAPAKIEMLSEMLGDGDCLAAIAGREVLVLYGTFKGNEAYAVNRSFGGNLSLNALFANLGFGGSAERKADFDRTDVTLIWALTKVHLDDPLNFPAGMPEDLRVETANRLIRNESRFADRALPKLKVSAPTADEAERLLIGLEGN